MRFDRFSEKHSGASHLCGWTQARLLAYADGDLNPAERKAVKSHLDDCPHCQQELALALRAEQALTSAPFAIPPPGDLRAGFYAKLAEAEVARAPRRFGVQWGTAFSACAVILFAVSAWRILPSLSTESSLKPLPQNNALALAGREKDKNRGIPSMVLPAPPVVAKAKSQNGESRVFSSAPTENPRIASVPEPQNRVGNLKKTSLGPNSALMGKIVAEAGKTLKRNTHVSSGTQVASVAGVEKPGSPSPSLSRDRLSESLQGLKRLGLKAKDARAKKAAIAMLTTGQAQPLGGESASALSTRALRVDKADYMEHRGTTMTVGYVVASNVPEEGDIKLEVRDEVRGFRATASYANRMELRDDGEVLTIEAHETIDDDQ